MNPQYEKPEYVPDSFQAADHTILFNDETAYGEQTAWVYLSDETSIEITHESYDVKTPFFSIRRHCSDEDYDNGEYKSTCGVLSIDNADNMNEVVKIVTEILNDLTKSGITIKE